VRNDRFQAFLGHVHFQTNKLFPQQCAFQKQRNLFNLVPFRLVFPGVMVGNQLGVGQHQFMDDPQSMRLDGAAGFCHLHNGIGQTGNDFGLCGAPGKFDLNRNTPFGKIISGKLNQFRGNLHSLKVFRRSGR